MKKERSRSRSSLTRQSKTLMQARAKPKPAGRQRALWRGGLLPLAIGQAPRPFAIGPAGSGLVWVPAPSTPHPLPIGQAPVLVAVSEPAKGARTPAPPSLPPPAHIVHGVPAPPPAVPLAPPPAPVRRGGAAGAGADQVVRGVFASLCGPAPSTPVWRPAETAATPQPVTQPWCGPAPSTPVCGPAPSTPVMCPQPVTPPGAHLVAAPQVAGATALPGRHVGIYRRFLATRPKMPSRAPTVMTMRVHGDDDERPPHAHGDDRADRIKMSSANPSSARAHGDDDERPPHELHHGGVRADRIKMGEIEAQLWQLMQEKHEMERVTALPRHPPNAHLGP